MVFFVSLHIAQDIQCNEIPSKLLLRKNFEIYSMDLQSQISDIKPIQNSKQPLIITLIYSFTSCHDRSLFTNIQLLFPSTSKASLGKHVYCTFKVIRKFWHGYYLCKKI